MQLLGAKHGFQVCDLKRMYNNKFGDYSDQ